MGWTLKDPFVVRAVEYCCAVVACEIPAGRYVRLACKRQLDDIARQGEGYPFVFNEEAAGRACRFVEMLSHARGPLAGTPIRLEPWQLFVLTSAFGWVSKATGKRRFRSASIFAPRGNGITLLDASVGNLCAFGSGERDAQVFSVAPHRDQARIVTETARESILRAPKVAPHFLYLKSRSAITEPASGSSFAPLAGRYDSLDGLSPDAVIVDCFHAHKSRELLGAARTMLMKHANTLLWLTSVAGRERRGPCREVYTEARRLLAGKHQDESHFAVIWEADRKDDPWASATWRKANPNWGVSVAAANIEHSADRAARLSSERPYFFANHLGIWPARELRKREKRAA